MLIRRSLRKIVLGGVVAMALALGGIHAGGNVHWKQLVADGGGGGTIDIKNLAAILNSDNEHLATTGGPDPREVQDKALTTGGGEQGETDVLAGTGELGKKVIRL